jgi:2-methylcitrate dehydratase PrpD
MNQAEAVAASERNRANVAGGFTAHVVSEVRKISSLKLSENVLERTRHAVLDWLGVSISGSQQESARIVQQVLKAEGGGAVSRVIGTPLSLTARQAALAVGIAGHSQDYDDMGIGGHPSVVVLPAVFAVAEELGVDGKTAVEAILYGYEAMNMVSSACGQTSYPRGFHCTGTFGAFGATVGVGRLLKLDAIRLQRALGIAGSQAAGLKANFGTMSKHLNAGNAAAVGVLSARLAEGGYTGATDVIESRQGFAVTHNQDPNDFDSSRPEASLGQRLAVEKIMFKPHAACGGTHSGINGIRALKAKRPFAADDVQDVELVVSEQALTVCAIPEPTSGVEGMFSLRYAASLALTDGSTGPSGFTDERVRDPALIAVRKKIKVTPISGGNAGSPTEVRVRLKTGEMLTTCLNALIVTPDAELGDQWKVLEAKFHDIVAPVLGDARSKELVNLVRRIDTLKSIRELTERTAPST